MQFHFLTTVFFIHLVQRSLSLGCLILACWSMFPKCTFSMRYKLIYSSHIQFGITPLPSWLTPGTPLGGTHITVYKTIVESSSVSWGHLHNNSHGNSNKEIPIYSQVERWNCVKVNSRSICLKELFPSFEWSEFHSPFNIKVISCCVARTSWAWIPSHYRLRIPTIQTSCKSRYFMIVTQFIHVNPNQ